MANFSGSQHRTLHREVWELLPWLANDTLSDAETQRCERHIDECADCRDEFQAQQSLRQQIQSGKSVLHTPHASLRKLMARIDQEEVLPPLPSAPPASTHRTRWLSAAVVLLAVGLVSFGGFMSWKLNELREAPRYVTVSAPTPQLPVATVVARAVFADSLSVSDLNSLLRSHQAQVIAGPSEAGVYTLAFPGISDRQAEAAVVRLRGDPQVRFAERAGPGTLK